MPLEPRSIGPGSPHGATTDDDDRSRAVSWPLLASLVTPVVHGTTARRLLTACHMVTDDTARRPPALAMPTSTARVFLWRAIADITAATVAPPPITAAAAPAPATDEFFALIVDG